MESERLLKGKRAIITGASRGMGQAISRAYAQSGADVCLISRKLADVETLAEEVEKWGVRAFGVQGDVSDSKLAEAATHEAIEKLGGVDILVCAAGFPFDPELWNKSLHELVDEDFAKVFNSDAMGSFRAAKEAIPEMIQQKNGVIILFSSTPAVSGYNKGGPYTVAKSAVRGLAKEIACEYGHFNIRAYAIAPGNIKTDATFNNLSKEEQDVLASESSMKRWGNPSEVARVCVVLGSDNMSFVTGQTIIVDGGTVML
ncbi:MAG TPA: SDR family NAD(P)-dependent oxidoreductase [Nitrososphaerales archaeon]|nr:SDR family NAD(P)-dependent oxidoreductase [Nitrososphaerales archaeon]